MGSRPWRMTWWGSFAVTKITDPSANSHWLFSGIQVSVKLLLSIVFFELGKEKYGQIFCIAIAKLVRTDKVERALRARSTLS